MRNPNKLQRYRVAALHETRRDGVKVDRLCRLFYCSPKGDSRCCRDCPECAACADACLNSPERCGLIEAKNKSVSKLDTKNSPEQPGEGKSKTVTAHRDAL